MARNIGIALGIVIFWGIGAFGDGAPVWPAGTNPKTAAPINGFCDAQQAIMDGTLLSELLPPEWMAVIVPLEPATGDVNGISWATKDPLTFSVYGNAMLDCSIELKLVEEVLRDTSFDVNGLTHARVHAAWNQIDAQLAADTGMYWVLFDVMFSGWAEVLKGHMIVGDGDATFSDLEGSPPEFNRVDTHGSAGFVKTVMFLVGANVTHPYIDVSAYDRLPQYFSKCGDADGDGERNDIEYMVYGPAGYVAAALNPAVRPCDEDCGPPCGIEFSGVHGGGWVQEDTPLELAVTTTGEFGFVAYQWFKNGAPLPGATDLVYTVPNPTNADSGTYLCQATDGIRITVDTGPIPVEVVPEGGLSVAGLASLGVAVCAMLGAGIAAVRKARRT